MPLTPYLKEAAFGPEAVEAMNRAFVAICKSLGLGQRDDKLTQIVARTVIDVGRTGERDAERIYELALQNVMDSTQRSA